VQSINSFQNKLFQINNQNFEQEALKLYQYQYEHNRIYREYVDYLPIDNRNIKDLKSIPFMPISFFKHHRICTGSFKASKVFESSGTTGPGTSRHFIEDVDFYHEVSYRIFSNFFGPLRNCVVFGLLPSYLERTNSSLVSMVNHFISISGRTESGFFLDNLDKLLVQLRSLKDDPNPVYLFGVTFALLELVGKHFIKMDNLTILETGGMKGRGKEMIREELHRVLKNEFNRSFVSSEYGMTELLSQAYMTVDGLFHTPPWMKVFVRDINDPFAYIPQGKSGAINVIDLANIHSCAFIETEDLGVQIGDGFKVLGRLDNSDMRGCNLLVT